VSNNDLMRADVEPTEEFWSAVALCAAEAVKDAVLHGGGRHVYAADAFRVAVNVGRAKVLATDLARAFNRGDLVLAFDA